MRTPLIFIVYQESELQLAESLKNLLESWGYRVFYCRQHARDGKSYRKELRTKLCRSDLVLLLLSREFEWSTYCQAEAGTTMALEKPFIPIVVPPATTSDVVNNIAKVLEGSHFIKANDEFFLPKLKDAMAKELATSRSKLKQLISKLESVAAVALSPAQISDHRLESECRAKVGAAVTEIANKYSLCQPPKMLSSVWPSLHDIGCRGSIIGNITQSLRSNSEETSLAFVGVSLKYSLELIKDALKEATKSRHRDGAPKKKLTIQLVHMDDQSHILHALQDTRDVNLIRLHFDTGWSAISGEWTKLCDLASIDLQPPQLCRIDYIPSRVGILIDNEILYSGRCAFTPVGAGALPVFHLDVGELEYQFYKKNNSTDPLRSDKAIEEFIGFLKAYGDTKNNAGVTPVWESTEWLERLTQCVQNYKGTGDLTFISASATKFESMILRLLERMSKKRAGEKAKVIVYVQDSGKGGQRISDLANRIKKNLGHIPGQDELEIRSYQHPATFRAVIVGDAGIGLQSYINADDTVGGSTKKIPLGLIFTRCFRQFAELKESLLTFADGEPSPPTS